jgi:hypothetical protein
MMNLPPPRREWRCKEKNKKTNVPCNQRLYQDERQVHASGKKKILNAENGRGGRRGEPHVCPDRLDGFGDHTNRNVNWLLYHYHQEHLACGYCGEKYNSYKNPLCPICYRLECRKCGNRQQWIVLEPWQPTTCSACGYDKLEVVLLSRDKYAT